MKRHLRGVAVALALLPTLSFAQSPTQAAPASAAVPPPGVLRGYVRPEIPTSSPDKEWLLANRALREDGGTDMGGMQTSAKLTDANATDGMTKGDKPMSSHPANAMRMQGMETPKPVASAPAEPHASHQMKNNGH